MNPIELSLDYLNASRLALPVTDRMTVCLVGCGGTGSWLAPAVARICKLAMEKFGKRITVGFFDPDQVEEKNCYRQNFCPGEIGRNKADTLAYRYGLAWGIEIYAVMKSFQEIESLETSRGVTLLIGCVDNQIGRKAIQDMAQRTRGAWWLDCGNTKSYGQVLIGSGDRQPEDPFALKGYCTWLPLPSQVHPELVEIWDLEQYPEIPMDLSCADLALLDSQGLAINQRVAAEATDYLVRMLLTRDLRKMATYMDLESGSSRSVYITRENVEMKLWDET